MLQSAEESLRLLNLDVADTARRSGPVHLLPFLSTDVLKKALPNETDVSLLKHAAKGWKSTWSALMPLEDGNYTKSDPTGIRMLSLLGGSRRSARSARDALEDHLRTTFALPNSATFSKFIAEALFAIDNTFEESKAFFHAPSRSTIVPWFISDAETIANILELLREYFEQYGDTVVWSPGTRRCAHTFCFVPIWQGRNRQQKLVANRRIKSFAATAAVRACERKTLAPC